MRGRGPCAPTLDQLCAGDAEGGVAVAEGLVTFTIPAPVVRVGGLRSRSNFETCRPSSSAIKCPGARSARCAALATFA
ncbi:hypothetical protein [Nonomuraea sp. NPDC003709]|uniref:hypothetical protein n=1 Tax=Nonomuraea sp. NPDC003709 TaxID=3154450 RepID=UPI0033A6BE47